MAYKEVSRVEITEVIRQWQAGRGIRGITRSTGISRNTIRKYIQHALALDLSQFSFSHVISHRCYLSLFRDLLNCNCRYYFLLPYPSDLSIRRH
jgi:hypothetical protein